MTDFAKRIRARYPEGLTGVISVGGTRTTYILENHKQTNDPGKISDVSDYAQNMQARYLNLAEMFFDLGGQNIILPVLSYQSFYERGEEYAKRYTKFAQWLVNDNFQAFYHRMEVNPYFIGIDTLLHLPESEVGYELGRVLQDFQNNWDYQDGRKKILWEIAPIPLFSYWQAQFTTPTEEQAELQKQLSQATDMNVMHDLLYRYYSKAAFGTELPVPHFYIASNRNGDLKLRSPIALSLICGGSFRMFFTPYPSLFMTKNVLQEILQDLAFGREDTASVRSFNTDYSGKFTEESIEAERQRIMELQNDPEAILGMSRRR
jgi:hypothetical protein